MDRIARTSRPIHDLAPPRVRRELAEVAGPDEELHLARRPDPASRALFGSDTPRSRGSLTHVGIDS